MSWPSFCSVCFHVDSLVLCFRSGEGGLRPRKTVFCEGPSALHHVLYGDGPGGKGLNNNMVGRENVTDDKASKCRYYQFSCWGLGDVEIKVSSADNSVLAKVPSSKDGVGQTIAVCALPFVCREFCFSSRRQAADVRYATPVSKAQGCHFIPLSLSPQLFFY